MIGSAGWAGTLQLSSEPGTRSQLKRPQDPLKRVLGPSFSFARQELGEPHSGGICNEEAAITPSSPACWSQGLGQDPAGEQASTLVKFHTNRKRCLVLIKATCFSVAPS